MRFFDFFDFRRCCGNDRFFDQVRDRLTAIPCVPNGSGAFRSNANRTNLTKAAARVYLIYEEPRKCRITVWKLQNRWKKTTGFEVGKINEIHFINEMHFL